MDNLDSLSLNKNLSYRNMSPKYIYISEINPTNFFSPFGPVKVTKLVSNINIQNNITNNNFQIYNQNINIIPPSNVNIQKKTLVLDLDETLVHSSMTPFSKQSDITIKINVKGRNYTVYVLKRPFLEEFLLQMSYIYEIIVFTASLGEYAEPLLKIIDTHKVVKYILNRGQCLLFEGMFIKDLGVINRDIKNIIIIDNNPISYMKNKENGIPILSWFDDPKDKELIKIIPLLKYLSKVDDVRPIIKQIVYKKNDQEDDLNYNLIDKMINEYNSFRPKSNFNYNINPNENNSIDKTYNLNNNNYKKNQKYYDINQNMNNNSNDNKKYYNIVSNRNKTNNNSGYESPKYYNIEHDKINYINNNKLNNNQKSCDIETDRIYNINNNDNQKYYNTEQNKNNNINNIDIKDNQKYNNIEQNKNNNNEEKENNNKGINKNIIKKVYVRKINNNGFNINLNKENPQEKKLNSNMDNQKPLNNFLNNNLKKESNNNININNKNKDINSIENNKTNLKFNLFFKDNNIDNQKNYLSNMNNESKNNILHTQRNRINLNNLKKNSKS